jgi:hypothetical protein
MFEALQAHLLPTEYDDLPIQYYSASEDSVRTCLVGMQALHPRIERVAEDYVKIFHYQSDCLLGWKYEGGDHVELCINVSGGRYDHDTVETDKMPIAYLWDPEWERSMQAEAVRRKEQREAAAAAERQRQEEKAARDKEQTERSQLSWLLTKYGGKR